MKKLNTSHFALGCMILGAVTGCGKQGSSSDPAANGGSDNGAPSAANAAGGTNPYAAFNATDVQGEKNLATLVNDFPQAKVEQPSQAWAGYWWAYTENGIDNGKYDGGESSAAKYDAARGITHGGAYDWEKQYHGAKVKGIQGWWGHCNGWSAASALLPEPRDTAVVNGISFNISDIKALYAEMGMSVDADYYGNRVDWAQDYNTPKYTDTVPDQYLLVLTNYMGMRKQAVNIDRYTGDQVWNQPLAGYKIQAPTPADYLGASPDAPNVYRILITSTIWWREDGVDPNVQTPDFDFTENNETSARTLRAEIWMDGPAVFDASGKLQSSGNIIVTRSGDYFAGGAWRMGEGIMVDAWPDYMWVPFGFIKPTDPNQDYANPFVDSDWIQKYLKPGQTTNSDEHSVPVPSHTPDPDPSASPHPTPSPTPTVTPHPTATPTPRPTPTSTGGLPWPFPGPSHDQ